MNNGINKKDIILGETYRGQYTSKEFMVTIIGEPYADLAPARIQIGDFNVYGIVNIRTRKVYDNDNRDIGRII